MSCLCGRTNGKMQRILCGSLVDLASNGFITRFRAAVSVLVGSCCPALLNCIDVDVHTVVLLGK